MSMILFPLHLVLLCACLYSSGVAAQPPDTPAWVGGKCPGTYVTYTWNVDVDGAFDHNVVSQASISLRRAAATSSSEWPSGGG